MWPYIFSIKIPEHAPEKFLFVKLHVPIFNAYTTVTYSQKPASVFTQADALAEAADGVA